LGLAGSFLLTSLLNLLAVNKLTGLPLELREWLLKPAVIAAAIALTGRYIYCFFEIFSLGAGLTILLTLTADMLIAAFLLLLTGILKPSEWLKFAGVKK
jgi:stage V sporulation protein B